MKNKEFKNVTAVAKANVYFDGKVVYWGNPEQTESDALASAQNLKAFILNRIE